MKKYFVCIYFESSVDDGVECGKLVEESIRLLLADNDQQALEKAVILGKQSEHEYLNEEGATVSWRFVRVIDVQEFCEEVLDDGAEVYSRLNRLDN